MPPQLSLARVRELLEPYYTEPSNELLAQLSVYLELLLRWNARTNLTSIRVPEEIVRRHFGESLFASRYLPETGTLLDLGSGAGFPGVPIQLALPDLRVTLAESQNKKSSFLREVVRVLKIPTEVWAGRVEDLPMERMFDVVTLRAVDSPDLALELARGRLAQDGIVAHLTATPSAGGRSIPLPGSQGRLLHLFS